MTILRFVNKQGILIFRTFTSIITTRTINFNGFTKIIATKGLVVVTGRNQKSTQISKKKKLTTLKNNNQLLHRKLHQTPRLNVFICYVVSLVFDLSF